MAGIIFKKDFPWIQPIHLTMDRMQYRSWYQLLGQGTSHKNLDLRRIDGQTQAYLQCPAVNSILNKKARAYTNGRWVIEDEKGNEIQNQEKLKIQQMEPELNQLSFSNRLQ